MAHVQATLRRRILRAFVGRGLLESFESKEMLACKHSGFSVDAAVCIEAHDRAALERLLRYWAEHMEKSVDRQRSGNCHWPPAGIGKFDFQAPTPPSIACHGASGLAGVQLHVRAP